MSERFVLVICGRSDMVCLTPSMGAVSTQYDSCRLMLSEDLLLIGPTHKKQNISFQNE